MLRRGWSEVITAIALLCVSSSAQETCCNQLADRKAIAGIDLKATFVTIQLNDDSWDLQVNISWSNVKDYDRYVVEIETYSDPTGKIPFSNPIVCPVDGVSDMNWKVVNGIQFGSLQRITMYFTKVGETKRGPHTRSYRDSPDCFDETKSITFCKKQAVQYAGKPLEVKVLNMTLSNNDKHVTVVIQWRQPIHINPETPISYYELLWYGDETATNKMKLNMTFDAGAYVVTELDTPLRVNTSYALYISPIVIAGGTNRRALTREMIFTTSSPSNSVIEPNVDVESHTVAIAIIIAATVIIVVTLVLVFLRKLYHHKDRRSFGALR